jgi:hypothetical protein
VSKPPCPTAPGPAVLRSPIPDRWRYLRPFAGRPCEILAAEQTDFGTFVRVRFDPSGDNGGDGDEGDGAPAPEFKDIPAAFFAVATNSPAKKTRRSPLKLTEPKDDRTEAQRQAEGVAWLRGLGYTVIETDTHRGKAICGKCSRSQKRRVETQCPTCHGPGFSPTTGADAGLADTEVQDARRWPGVPAVTLNVEWKAGASAPRREAQALREARGEIVVVWDLPSLAGAIFAFEDSLKLEVHAEVLAYLIRHRRIEAQGAESGDQ